MKTKKELSAIEKATDVATTKAVATKVVKEKELKTKTKEKNFLYKFQVDEKGLNEKQQKKNRNKLRRQLENICNKFVTNVKDVDANTKEFISFYKKNYILNDFSIESLSNSNSSRKEDILNALSIVKKQLEKK